MDTFGIRLRSYLISKRITDNTSGYPIFLLRLFGIVENVGTIVDNDGITMEEWMILGL